MRIQMDREELIALLVTTSKALSSKTTLPILEGFLLSAKEGLLTVTCTDLALGIETIGHADVEEEGSLVMPGRLFNEIVRRMPEGLVTIIGDADNKAYINSNGSKTTLQAFSSQEYPTLPQVSKKEPVAIGQGKLRDMIRQSIFAVAADEARPILTGALMEIEDNVLHVVSLDGYRFAMRSEALDHPYPPMQWVVPGRSLNEIGRVLDEKGDALLYLHDKHMMVDLDHTRIVSRLLEGEYIKYHQILPTEWQTRVVLPSRTLMQSVDRASLMAREGRNNLMKFSIGGGKVIITANSEQGNVYEELNADIQGKEIEIAFNARYFSDMLKVIDDMDIQLLFQSNVSPCVVQPVEGDRFLYLVLPVRVFS